MIWRSGGSDRKPVEVERAPVPHEPSAKERAALRALELVFIDASLAAESARAEVDREAIDLLLDARNGQAEVPLPRRMRGRPS